MTQIAKGGSACLREHISPQFCFWGWSGVCFLRLELPPRPGSRQAAFKAQFWIRMAHPLRMPKSQSPAKPPGQKQRQKLLAPLPTTLVRCFLETTPCTSKRSDSAQSKKRVREDAH